MAPMKALSLMSLLPMAVVSFPFPCTPCNHNHIGLKICTALKNNADDNSDVDSSFNDSLTQRIAEVQESESLFVSGLQNRVKKVVEAEELDTKMSQRSDVELPVLTLDALLPGQRLTGSTTDPTFCNFLCNIGLGSTFVMTSINNRQRRIRRFGTIAKIELVDVDANNDAQNNFSPTSVTFCIVGTKRRCVILGDKTGMKTRIGRWRRSYDPDGEEARLGWGLESFVDSAKEIQFDTNDHLSLDVSSDTQWTNSRVIIINEEDEDANISSETVFTAREIDDLIEQWLTLATDQTTYDNVDVVARTRRKTGEPGLTVNAAALLKRVQQELGPRPPPERPTALALWGSALINPLPALGVATELRGAVLEADGADKKLAILKRGLIKSINNLNGSRPLNM